jgi:hypothetical protein
MNIYVCFCVHLKLMFIEAKTVSNRSSTEKWNAYILYIEYYTSNYNLQTDILKHIGHLV